MAVELSQLETDDINNITKEELDDVVKTYGVFLPRTKLLSRERERNLFQQCTQQMREAFSDGWIAASSTIGAIFTLALFVLFILFFIAI
jgi:hypothetical protein